MDPFTLRVSTIAAAVTGLVALVGAIALSFTGHDVPGALWALVGAGGATSVALPVSTR